MNEPFKTTRLDNGVIIDFFSQGNRYYGDFHRVKICAIATIPLDVESLPVDLQPEAARCSGVIKYEKNLERMGVATARVAEVTQSLLDDFTQTVGSYLEKESFAAGLLRKNLPIDTKRTRFSP